MADACAMSWPFSSSARSWIAWLEAIGLHLSGLLGPDLVDSRAHLCHHMVPIKDVYSIDGFRLDQFRVRCPLGQVGISLQTFRSSALRSLPSHLLPTHPL